MSVKTKWLSMGHIMNNLTGQQQIREIERKQRYYCENRGERRMKDKLHVANNMMNRLNIQGANRDEVLDIVKKYDLNDLLKNCSQEVTIACACFHVMKLYNSRAKLHNYRLFNDLEISENIMITFYTNLYKLYSPFKRPCTDIKECY